MSSRAQVNASDENDHMLVPVIVEVRDNLGGLAVQVLAAREDLKNLSYSEMLQKLYDITADLHQEYDRIRTNLY